MTERILIFLNLLAVAVLVGKIVFLSFVTAPVLSRTLDADSFAKVVRSLFPQYYGLGMVSAAIGWTTSIALGLLNGFEPVVLIPATLWLGVLGIEHYCRTPLIAQINELSDQLKAKQARGLNTPLLQQQRDGLHRLSVQLNSVVLFMGLCLIGLSGITP
ncbi:MAG: DUF4149 domain-containing protein [Nitrospirota bacterium]|jgi:hypothetical protein|nr:DUF4149 domain-containing protein [Nitrospirota bacterium]MDH4362084.1 DUF4149 domain-containing protein [Nitrospirota bacterium]MDH5574965.1 DUF4149 domain-containing protein [Nitrospirota bacterium]